MTTSRNWARKVLNFGHVEVPVSANSPTRIIRFSTFEVNFQTGELRQQGHRVRLQEQPLQVLTALLERPGQMVTREELRSRLWSADTFVDFDHSLNAAIKRLRDALGDSAETPIFIETLARRGYRFIAPITTTPPVQNVKLRMQNDPSLQGPSTQHPVPSLAGREAELQPALVRDQRQALV